MFPSMPAIDEDTAIDNDAKGLGSRRGQLQFLFTALPIQRAMDNGHDYDLVPLYVHLVNGAPAERADWAIRFRNRKREQARFAAW